MEKVTLGLIVGSRNFFPAELCQTGRETMLQVMEEEGIHAIALGEKDTRFGSVETLSDAVKAGELFRQHAGDLDGFLVTLPNFGDERAVANSIRFSEMNAPVLVHAYPDRNARMTHDTRRDSFCGKMSVCNNLRQYGIPFTLPRLHTVDPTAESFRQDLRRFAATCRVVKGVRRARIGQIGARPAAFNTVRYSEKLLERAGVSVETLDLSEAIGRASALSDEDPAVQAKRESIVRYVKAQQTPDMALGRMARFGVVMDRWMEENRLVATSVQCWTAVEEFFGMVPCTVMSLLSNQLMPSACETDVAGALAMYALALATGQPSALADWNNNYEDDPDKCVLFHCSNLPAQVFTDIPTLTQNPGLAASFGEDRAYGLLFGRMKAEPFTYLRISTDDLTGSIRAYVGEGKLTDDPLETYGGYGVAHIERFQELLQHICTNGYEHHVAINLNSAAPAVYEALSTYMGWPVYWHR